MWRYVLILLLVPLWPLASAFPSPNVARSPAGFALAVNTKIHASRNFVRDWAAAHHKWGKGVSREVASSFALLDDGKSSLYLSLLIHNQMLRMCSWSSRC
jgi:hypothetical protein